MNIAAEKPILCVDLDETLILIDSLYHSMFLLLLAKPWLFVWFCFFLGRNRAGAKAWIAKNISLNPASFPFRGDLLEYLKKEKAEGRKLYLVSAADQNIVSAFAGHVGIFDGAYGSDGVRNLKGANKAAFIRESLSPYFVYAGDCHADKKIWQHAAAAILCGKAANFKETLGIPIEAVFPEKRLLPF